MPIQISTQPLKIDWQIEKGYISQSGNASLSLNLKTSKPKLEMTSKQPQIIIDQSQCFAEAGLKDLKTFMGDSVSYGLQIVNKGISRIVSEGNEWINIHNGTDPIPEQAVSAAYEQFNKEFNYAAIPQSRPEISLDAGKVNYQLKPGRVNNNSTPKPVKMNYHPWQMQYAVKQYNSIQIQFNKSNVSFSA